MRRRKALLAAALLLFFAAEGMLGTGNEGDANVCAFAALVTLVLAV